MQETEWDATVMNWPVALQLRLLWIQTGNGEQDMTPWLVSLGLVFDDEAARVVPDLIVRV